MKRSPLRRVAGMRRSRSQPWDAHVSGLLAFRSAGRCEVCGGSLVMGFSRHHRRPRGMGGSKHPETHGVANLLLVCGSGTSGCHGNIEQHRFLALSAGWLVKQHDDPASVPVRLHDGWWFLDNEGRRHRAP